MDYVKDRRKRIAELYNALYIEICEEVANEMYPGPLFLIPSSAFDKISVEASRRISTMKAEYNRAKWKVSNKRGRN